MKIFLTFILAMMFSGLAAAQPRNDRPPDSVVIDQTQPWNRADRRPGWCRHWDRGDYHRELRACGDDRYCRSDVRRRAERCGLR